VAETKKRKSSHRKNRNSCAAIPFGQVLKRVPPLWGGRARTSRQRSNDMARVHHWTPARSTAKVNQKGGANWFPEARVTKREPWDRCLTGILRPPGSGPPRKGEKRNGKKRILSWQRSRKLLKNQEGGPRFPPRIDRILGGARNVVREVARFRSIQISEKSPSKLLESLREKAKLGRSKHKKKKEKEVKFDFHPAIAKPRPPAPPRERPRPVEYLMKRDDGGRLFL